MSVDGVASVTTLPVVHGRAPASPLQGTLSLAFETSPAMSAPTMSDRGALQRFVPRLCAVLIEVLGGDRGIHQLLRWTTPEVYDDLVRRLTALNQTAGRDQRLRRLRAHVRSVHVSWPNDHAAEVSVHVSQGARSRALAARIELIEGRWLCSALQVG